MGAHVLLPLAISSKSERKLNGWLHVMINVDYYDGNESKIRNYNFWVIMVWPHSGWKTYYSRHVHKRNYKQSFDCWRHECAGVLTRGNNPTRKSQRHRCVNDNDHDTFMTPRTWLIPLVRPLKEFMALWKQCQQQKLRLFDADHSLIA
jgi:hypothetical protein